MAVAGLGTVMRKGLEGYDAGKRSVEREEDRAVQKETAQLGLDDAKFRAGRRDKLAAREDTQYNRKEEQYQRESKSKKAISNAMVNGDYSGVTDFLNEYTPDGEFYALNKNKDGTYTTFMKSKDGKTNETNFKTREEMNDKILPYVMMVGKNNPYEELEKGIKEKKAAAAKAGDRQHDMNKIDRKGAWDLRKAGLSGKGAGSKRKEALRKIANDMETRSKSRRGQMTPMGNIDMTGINSDLANYDGMIGAQLYNLLNLDTNTAYTKAYNMVSQLNKTAKDEAIKRFPEDDNKQAQYIRAKLEEGANKIIARIKSKAQKGLSRPPKIAGNSGSKTQKQIPYDKYLKAARAKNPNATDAQIKAFYNKKYNIKG